MPAELCFISVPCAMALNKMRPRFISVVKTATKELPQQYLSTVELAQRDDYKVVLWIHPITLYKLFVFVWVDQERL